MDKKTLYEALARVTTNSEHTPTQTTTVGLRFIKSHQQFNGTYKVVSVKTGRGKHGSKVMSVSRPDGSVLSDVPVGQTTKGLGTPVSDLLLSVSVNGQQFGSLTEQDSIASYPPNVECALAIKGAVTPLIGKDGYRLKIESLVEEFGGEWNVVSVKRSPGKFGQLVVHLKNKSRETKLWTYRHSGVIKTLMVGQ